MLLLGRYTTSRARIIELKKPPLRLGGLSAIPVDEVETAVLSHVGTS